MGKSSKIIKYNFTSNQNFPEFSWIYLDFLKQWNNLIEFKRDLTWTLFTVALGNGQTCGRWEKWKYLNEWNLWNKNWKTSNKLTNLMALRRTCWLVFVYLQERNPQRTVSTWLTSSHTIHLYRCNHATHWPVTSSHFANFGLWINLFPD